VQQPDHTLDLRGKACLVPVVTVQTALELLPPGSVLEVVAGSRATARDLEVWARQTGHEVLVSAQDAERGAYLRLRKPPAARTPA
jgi:tRNA 2-thiouridine synthesizing protein A